MQHNIKQLSPEEEKQLQHTGTKLSGKQLENIPRQPPTH